MQQKEHRANKLMREELKVEEKEHEVPLVEQVRQSRKRVRSSSSSRRRT